MRFVHNIFESIRDLIKIVFTVTGVVFIIFLYAHNFIETSLKIWYSSGKFLLLLEFIKYLGGRTSEVLLRVIDGLALYIPPNTDIRINGIQITSVRVLLENFISVETLDTLGLFTFLIGVVLLLILCANIVEYIQTKIKRRKKALQKIVLLKHILSFKQYNILNKRKKNYLDISLVESKEMGDVKALAIGFWENNKKDFSGLVLDKAEGDWLTEELMNLCNNTDYNSIN